MHDRFRPPVRRPEKAAGLDRETLAAQVLGFVAADADRLSRFMALTGSTPASLRQAAQGPAFADSVLDYLASNETMLVEFARSVGQPPEVIGKLAWQDNGSVP